MITVHPREPGLCYALSAPSDMTCVTPKSGNRHTSDRHQHETSAPEPARQNRYTDPPHTAGADRRHSHVTHQIEDGVDPVFVQRQVGHRYQSTTAIYTGVSGDFMNTMMRKALNTAFTTDEEVKR